MRLQSAISLAALLVLAACQDGTGPDGPYFPPWPTAEYALVYGGGLRLSVYEAPGEVPSDSAGSWRWHGVREPRVALVLKTVREWGGCGTWLEADVSQEGNVTSITAGPVVRVPMVCGGMGPPAATFSRFLAFPEGESTLLLDVLGSRFEYRVRVTPATIDLVRLTPGGARGPVRVQEELETFWRFPSNSFVLHCGHLTPEASCEALFVELAGELGFERFAFPAWGHPPFPRMEAAANGTAHFRYENTEDFARVSEFLCRAVLPGSGRIVMALSWRNEEANAPCRLAAAAGRP